MKNNSRKDRITSKQRLEGLDDQKDLIYTIVGVALAFAIAFISYYLESGVNYE